MTLRFDAKSLVIALAIFVIEVIIALFVNDRIIRPYVGDVLVVLLMYYFIKAFIQTKPIYLITGVLLFAYVVEVSQYFRLVDILGMRNNDIVRVVIGSHFTWIDIFAYTLGAFICYCIDRKSPVY